MCVFIWVFVCCCFLCFVFWECFLVCLFLVLFVIFLNTAFDNCGNGRETSSLTENDPRLPDFVIVFKLLTLSLRPSLFISEIWFQVSDFCNVY